MTVRRQCFYVDESMVTPQGYIPALITEGEPGYNLMLGNSEFAQPWYWGDTLEQARKAAREANAKRGLSEADARAIVDSSIATALRRDSAREAADERWEGRA